MTVDFSDYAITSVLPAKLSEGGLFKSCNSSKALGTTHLKLGTGQHNPLLGDHGPQQLVSPAKSSLLCTGHKQGTSVFIQGPALASAETAK